jgi:hypothetical protein
MKDPGRAVTRFQLGFVPAGARTDRQPLVDGRVLANVRPVMVLPR